MHLRRCRCREHFQVEYNHLNARCKNALSPVGVHVKSRAFQEIRSVQFKITRPLQLISTLQGPCMCALQCCSCYVLLCVCINVLFKCLEFNVCVLCNVVRVMQCCACELMCCVRARGVRMGCVMSVCNAFSSLANDVVHLCTLTIM